MKGRYSLWINRPSAISNTQAERGKPGGRNSLIPWIRSFRGNTGLTWSKCITHLVNETEKLIREDDEVLYGDSGYLNAAAHMESIRPERLESMEFRINVRPSSIRMSRNYKGIRWEENIENRKSSTRCKVEHPFLIVKRQFGYCKTVYKGLAKNMNRFNVLFACANLVMCIRAGRTESFCMG